jgi:O-antigen/teichoic acid export membrane protein
MLLLILLVQAVLHAGAGTVGWVLLASNQHRRLTWWALGNTALALVLATILAPCWGTVGVAISVLTGDIVCGFMVYPYLAAQLLRITAFRLYSAFLQAVGSVLIPAGIGWVVASMFPDLGIFGAIFIATIVFVLAVYWVLGKQEIWWLGIQVSNLLRWRG